MITSSQRFPVFAALYMTALLLEITQDWDLPFYPLAFCALAAGIALVGITPARFLSFLVASSSYFLLVRVPEVANHVMLILFCNLVLIVCLVRAFWRRGKEDEDALAPMWPLLRVTLMLVYFIPGFHKLNRDFFDPAVSCAVGLASGTASSFASSVFGIPVAALLAVGGAVVLVGIWRRTRREALGSQAFRLVLALGAGAAVVSVALVALRSVFGLPAPLALALHVATIAGTLLWEMGGGLLLAVPAFQAPMLLVSWGMHSALALDGFVDFGSLALALMVSFVPEEAVALWHRERRFRLGPWHFSRLTAYSVVTVAVLATVCALGLKAETDMPVGLLFVAMSVLLAWPLITRVFVGRWRGVPVWTARTPRWLLALPALMLLYGATGYLGLRTAGNFSMFSNLRTEGPRSNHLLLGSNPLKRWGYQEDVVHVLEIDDRRARAGHKYVSLQGMYLPMVEFRKLIHTWTQRGMVVPVAFEYGGETYRSADITRDPAWRTEKRTPEMYLLDFRVIQPDGPNACRW